MFSTLIAGALTLVLGFAIGWLAAWLASLRLSGAALSTLWGRVLLGAGALAVVLLALVASPLVQFPTPASERIARAVTPTGTRTPFATSTPYPTGTPYPTATPPPTYTPYPTFTPLAHADGLTDHVTDPIAYLPHPLPCRLLLWLPPCAGRARRGFSAWVR